MSDGEAGPWQKCCCYTMGAEALWFGQVNISFTLPERQVHPGFFPCTASRALECNILNYSVIFIVTRAPFSDGESTSCVIIPWALIGQKRVNCSMKWSMIEAWNEAWITQVTRFHQHKKHVTRSFKQDTCCFFHVCHSFVCLSLCTQERKDSIWYANFNHSVWDRIKESVALSKYINRKIYQIHNSSLHLSPCSPTNGIRGQW